MTEEKTDLQKLPSRIKYYLLEWKDQNMGEYMSIFGQIKLNELDRDALVWLFSHASNKDREGLLNKDWEKLLGG